MLFEPPSVGGIGFCADGATADTTSTTAGRSCVDKFVSVQDQRRPGPERRLWRLESSAWRPRPGMAYAQWHRHSGRRCQGRIDFAGAGV